MRDFNKLFILTLQNIPRIGRKTIHKILNQTNPTSLKDTYILGIIKDTSLYNKRVVIPTLEDIATAKEKAFSQLNTAKEMGVEILTVLDAKFPTKLKNIEDYPVLIYCKGNIDLLYEDCVAIVGTREPSVHGSKIANRLGTLFSDFNYTIVSGLALGCDTEAHKGCLDNKGKTIAVLGSGVDNIYPSANYELSEDILKNNGLLISEQPLGTHALKGTLIDRDRLQSALSEAVIVVEAGVNSGTMHTVGCAVEQDKLISVYKHDYKYHKLPSVQGNLQLLKDKTTIPIFDKDTIYKLHQNIQRRCSINE